MGPAVFYILALWINTFLLETGSVDVSPKLHRPSSARIVRIKRQDSSNEWIENILYRMNDLEDEVAKSHITSKTDFAKTQTGVEELQGHFKALGFYKNISHETQLTGQNPCGSDLGNGAQRQNEMNWTLFGAFSCVKLVNGLFTFANATDICHKQFRTGEDIAHPAVVSLDSSEKAMDLLEILRGQRGLSSVWAGGRNISSTGIPGLNCTELSVGGENETDLEWRSVECDRLSRVVCEKPVVVSYVEVVRKQLEGKKEMEELEERLEKTNGDIQKLREEMKSLLGSFRVDLVAQMESKCEVTEAKLSEVRREKEELGVRVELLEGKLEELIKSTIEDKRLHTEEEAEVRRSMNSLALETVMKVSDLTESSNRRHLAAKAEAEALGRHLLGLSERLEVTESKVTRIEVDVKTLEAWRLRTNGQVESFERNVADLNKEVGQLRSEEKQSLQKMDGWELGGPTPFEVVKAMGVWFVIEEFYRSSRYGPTGKCWKFSFHLKGSSAVEYVGSRLSGGSKQSETWDMTTNSLTDHNWKYSTPGRRWLKTDYNNWGIITRCEEEDIKSCSHLWILSRTRTLPSASLEMLRNSVKTSGFPIANGTLIDQAGCSD